MREKFCVAQHRFAQRRGGFDDNHEGELSVCRGWIKEAKILAPFDDEAILILFGLIEYRPVLHEGLLPLVDLRLKMAFPHVMSRLKLADFAECRLSSGCGLVRRYIWSHAHLRSALCMFLSADVGCPLTSGHIGGAQGALDNLVLTREG